jgi:hypothetical protein
LISSTSTFASHTIQNGSIRYSYLADEDRGVIKNVF